MKLISVISILFAGTLSTAVTAAVTEEDFQVTTTENLITLCTASKDDPHYREAIHFCHGYLVGAYHYYRAEQNGPEGSKFLCMPDPRPSRNESIEMFIAWAKQHPEYRNELPVETEFRFLIEKWPCKASNDVKIEEKP